MSRSGEPQHRALLLTYGSAQRHTGGSLYNEMVVRGLTERGLPVTVHHLNRGGYVLAPLKGCLSGLGRLLSSQAFDLILVDELVHPSLSWLLSHAKTPLVPIVHLLRIDDQVGPIGRALGRLRERRLLDRASMIVANSEATARSVTRLCRRIPEIVVCLPGTVSAEIPTRVDVPTVPTILCVANFFPVKGQDLLIRALAQVQDIPWKLRLVGDRTVDPGFTRRVRRLVSRAGLRDRIELRGPVYGASLAEAYKGADLFVLPSRYEAYGMALAEAISYGLPVVAFDVGGVREVADGSGLLVPPENYRELANAIRRVLTNKDVFREARRASQNRGAGLPTWDETLDRLHTSLAMLIARSN